LSLLADIVRAKRARLVESLLFLRYYVSNNAHNDRHGQFIMAVWTAYLLICLCLKLDSFLLAGLIIASDGLT